MLPALRHWTWIDPITWPGSALRIRHAKPRHEVRAWLLAHAPWPFEETAEDLFEDSEHAGQRAHIAVREGLLEMHHFYGTRSEVETCENALLVEVAEGALGPMVWDVTDEDWHVYLASGDDAASLGRYIDAASDEALHRAHRASLITPRTFDAGEAETRLALLQGLARELSLGEIATLAAFGERLAARPTADLPRSWLVRVHPSVGAELAWFARLVFEAQPRLRISWQIT